jgi:hypothetical protein
MYNKYSRLTEIHRQHRRTIDTNLLPAVENPDSSVLSVSCVCIPRTKPFPCSFFKPSFYGLLFLVVLVCFCVFVPDVYFV